MTNWTEQTVDVLKHHLLQTLHGCFLLRIKKDLSLFTLTADCSSDITWSHVMCYLHFGNEVRNSRCKAADYCKDVCTYRGAWSIRCHEFGYWPITYESSLIRVVWLDPSVLFEFSLEIQVRRIQTTKEIPQNWSSRRRKKALHFLFFSRHHHHQNCLLFFVF